MSSTVYNHDFRLTADEPESTSRPVPGADRFGLQIIANEATQAALIVLQGSINGSDWTDLASATLTAPITGAGGTAKSPVIRYLRVVARTLTGDGAEVAAHVVTK